MASDPADFCRGEGWAGVMVNEQRGGLLRRASLADRHSADDDRERRCQWGRWSGGERAMRQQERDGGLVPGENLVIDSIPPIPSALAEAVSRYTEFRGAMLW